MAGAPALENMRRVQQTIEDLMPNDSWEGAYLPGEVQRITGLSPTTVHQCLVGMRNLGILSGPAKFRRSVVPGRHGTVELLPIRRWTLLKRGAVIVSNGGMYSLDEKG